MPDESPPTPARRSDDARPSRDDRSSRDPRPSTDPAAPGSGQLSRRSFLASAGTATAGLAATAGLGATAGCVELLPAMGQEIRFDDVQSPDPAPPRYREWAPAPDAADLDLTPDIVAVPNSDVEAVTGVPAEYGRGFLAPTLDYFGVGFGNYDLALRLFDRQTDVHVLEGPIAQAEVGPVVQDSGYEAGGEHRGYDRYVREDVPRTVAVTEGRILFGKGPRRDAAIDLALDARAGDVPPATEDPAFEQVTDAAGTRPFLMLDDGFSGIFDDYEIERIAVGIDFDESAFYYCHYLRFLDDVPSRSDVRDEVESMEFGEEADAVDVHRDDRFVSMVFAVSSDVVQSEYQPSGSPPHCTWSVEADDEGYRIVHEAGEAVPAEQLSVRDTWADEMVLDVQFAEEYATVGPGDSLRVPADAIEEGPLTVIWEHRNSTAELLEYRP